MIEEFIYLGLSTVLLFSVPVLRKTFFLRSSYNEKNKTEGRLKYFDFIRGLAILAVIFIHIGDGFFIDERGNQSAIKFLNSVFRFAIPFFLISSGILISKKKAWSNFYQKKIFRNFFPYIVITFLIGLFYETRYVEIFFGIFSGAALPPYYFMSVLLQLYIIYPLILRLSNTKYFLEFSFLFSSISFLLPLMWQSFGVTLFFRYLFFFSYGVAMKEKFLSNSFSLNLSEKVFYWGIVIYYLVATLYFQVYFYNSRLFFGIALFNLVFLYKNKFQKMLSYNLISFLGKNSLWIYLIHYLIISALYKYTVYLNNTFFQYTILVLIGLPVSILLSFIYKYTYNLIFNLVSVKPVK